MTVRALARGLALGLVGLSCVSSSPFETTPADVARAEPCRYMGTVHKESRQRIEVLRACQTVSYEAWLCMAQALKTLDVEFTARCKAGAVELREIVVRQRVLYAPCLPASAAETLECALLSSADDCLALGCGVEGALPPTAPPASAEAPRRAPATCGA
jgi:hypothetical protein